NVRVETPAQTLVGRHDNHADRAYRTLDHVGMPVVRMGVHEIRSDIPDLGRVGTPGAHAVLCLAHLGRRDHLHGFGDLSRVLHALDLVSNFLDSGHCCFLSRRYGRLTWLTLPGM